MTFDADTVKIVNVVGILQQDVRLAQLDRAFGYGPKGREFESSNAHVTKPRKHGVCEVFSCNEIFKFMAGKCGLTNI